jgi:hypothetical protein
MDLTQIISGLVRRLLRRYDIHPPEWKPPVWDTSSVPSSLEALRQYAEGHAQSAIAWYYGKKPWKAVGSQSFRLVTILATAVGGALPLLVAGGMFAAANQTPTERALSDLKYNQAGYICLGVAALSLALDRFFGSSTGWMRYITTAMAIETTLEQFRFEWSKLTAPLEGKAPSGDVLLSMIERMSTFSATVRALVEKETEAWVTEFQSNLTQLEKETKTAVDAARSQVEAMQKESKTAQDAVRPGAIDLTIENFQEIASSYDVFIDGTATKPKVESKTCGVLGVAPGMHELVVTAKMSDAVGRAAQLITVPAGQSVKVTLTLAKVRTAEG